MSFTQDLFSSRRNYTDGNTRIGELDRIWYDKDRNAFYISDGATPGGILIGGAIVGTRYYGSFYDVTPTQTISNVAAAYTMTISNTYSSNGVTLSSNDMVFANQGEYQIIFSIQFNNSDNARQRINIWFEQNGAIIPDSNSQFQIENSTAGTDARLIATTPFTVTAQAGDHVTMKWNATDTGVSIFTIPAVDGTIPRTPGVIITVTQI